MSTEEYWIGKGIDYERIWSDYFSGKDLYTNKFNSMKSYLLQIKFAEPASTLPLFNHEVIYKTIKGIYHDLKELRLTKEEYQNYGPLYLYSVERGSGIFEFIGELLPLILFIFWLHQPTREVFLDWCKAKTTELNIKNFKELVDSLKTLPPKFEKARENLLSQGLDSIKVSLEPYKDIKKSRDGLTDVSEIDQGKSKKEKKI